MRLYNTVQIPPIAKENIRLSISKPVLSAKLNREEETNIQAQTRVLLSQRA